MYVFFTSVGNVCEAWGKVTWPAATHFEPGVRDDGQFNLKLKAVTPGSPLMTTWFTDNVRVQIPVREMKNDVVKTTRTDRAWTDRHNGSAMRLRAGINTGITVSASECRKVLWISWRQCHTPVSRRLEKKCLKFTWDCLNEKKKLYIINKKYGKKTIGSDQRPWQRILNKSKKQLMN